MSTETFGTYQLIRKLAAGGMAHIFLARKAGVQGFEKLMVVKRILPHLAENQEFVQMFLDEARIAARLNHPNIVQIFDLGAQDGTYFIAMEYIHGEDVRRVWKRAENKSKPMPLPLVCRVIIDACAGLDYAHKKADQSGKPLNIVHRDVSPQNILVTFQGGVKIVDFGIAKAADQATVTRSGVLKGKYSYMSPEQAAGKKIDRRSDIFALGVVLHELLTGTRLFKRANDIATLNAVAACEVPVPSEINPRIPAELSAIALKALAKEPEQRYQHAAELQLALENFLIQRKLPASSAHLAAFMQEIYADRLAEEAREGHVLPEEERPAGDSVQASGSPKPATSSRSSKKRDKETPAPRGERTAADRPKRASSKLDVIPTDAIPLDEMKTMEDQNAIPSGAAHTFHKVYPGEPSESLAQTAVNPPRWRTGAAAIAVLCLVGAATLGVLRYTGLWGAGGPVTVTLSTKPDGAQILLDGRYLSDRTPTTLTGISSGAHVVIFSKDGFEDHRQEVDVPRSGALVVPLVQLAPRPALPLMRKVKLAVTSVPDGAQILVDGADKGSAPFVLESASGKVHRIAAVKPGFELREVEVTLGSEAEQKVELALKPRAASATDTLTAGQRDTSERGTGTVRFAIVPVTATAQVTCGTKVLGSTPMPGQKLPAGINECRFTSAEHGTRTERFELLPNETKTILVKFNAP